MVHDAASQEHGRVVVPPIISPAEINPPLPTFKFSQRFCADAEQLMQQVVREQEFRKGLMLVFAEFDGKLNDALADFGQKSLGSFAAKSQVQELSTAVRQRITWVEHDRVVRELGELRTYVDWKRDDMQTQFNQKADSFEVGIALKAKAEASETNEMKHRLQRYNIYIT